MQILALLFVLLLQASPPAPQAPTDYVVGAEDVLAITVVGTPELTSKFTVGADGAFDFPWIGRVQAAKQTLRELEQAISKRLIDGGFLLQPQVTVQVEQFRSQKVYVHGEVREPGQYPLTGVTTMIDLLAQAGVQATAGDEVLIYRREGSDATEDGPVLDPEKASDVEVLRIPKADIISGRAARSVKLQNRDTVFVPKGLSIFVYGHVKSPGRYAMEGKLNVLQAIALAGGPTERGAVNRARILRLVNGQQKEIKVKLTDFVQPGDTITVPSKWF